MSNDIKRVVGQYNDNGGAFIIFPDSSYNIIAYATYLTGDVRLQGDSIYLISNDREFSLYGRKNKDIKVGSKIMYNGHEKGKTYFGSSDSDSINVVRPLFSGDTNVFSYDYNYILQIDNNKTFGFTQTLPEWEGGKLDMCRFVNKEGYNDFIAIYNNMHDIPLVIKGIVNDNGEKITLFINGEATIIEKKPIENEIMEMYTSRYSLGKDVSDALNQKKYVFTNPAYHEYDPVSILGSGQYIALKDEPDTYIHNLAYQENGDQYTGNPKEYNNYFRIHKYNKIEPELSQQFHGKIDTNPLFIAYPGFAIEEVPDSVEASIDDGYSDEERAIRENILKLEEQIKGSTESGNLKDIPNIQYKIGCLYSDMYNHTLALEWYLKAAEHGSTDAQVAVGRYYQYGQGTTKDTKKAFECYEQAANSGSIKGLRALAMCYANGIGVKVDDNQRFKCLSKLLEKGFIPAHASIGYCYIKGIGVKKDKDEAVRWFQRGHEKGDKDSSFNLGVSYYKGVSVKKDYNTAFEMYLKSDTTFYVVQNALGECYLKGTGVEKDFEKAAYYYRQSLDYLELNNDCWTSDDKKMVKEMRKAFKKELKEFKGD